LYAKRKKVAARAHFFLRRKMGLKRSYEKKKEGVKNGWNQTVKLSVQEGGLGHMGTVTYIQESFSGIWRNGEEKVRLLVYDFRETGN